MLWFSFGYLSLGIMRNRKQKNSPENYIKLYLQLYSFLLRHFKQSTLPRIAVSHTHPSKIKVGDQ